MMEEEEEVELFGREEEGFIFVSCGVGCDVDFTITKDDGATGFGLGAGQHALHPGENFFNPEEWGFRLQRRGGDGKLRNRS